MNYILMPIQLNDYTAELGNLMVIYARKALEEYLLEKKVVTTMTKPPILKKNAGIFCTLKLNQQLRGCIGYLNPQFPLGEALVKASIQSAVHDPRFEPITYKELEKIVIELTVLTPPQLIEISDPMDYLEKIILGRDGLIAEFNHKRGLLLPQVPIEQNWTIEQFLEYTCMKAGILPHLWKDPEIKIYSFQGIIFKENQR